MRAPFYCIPYPGKVSSRADVDEMELKKRSTLAPTLLLPLLPLVPQPLPNVTHQLPASNATSLLVFYTVL